MMFQTIGLNTGSVRLDTLIFGLVCACAAVPVVDAIAMAAAAAAKWRRDILSI
jgi:threonine/homoserine/homoserine lactone efflux protein